MAKWVRVAPVFNYSRSKLMYHIVCQLSQNSVGSLSAALAVIAKANLSLLMVSAAVQPATGIPVVSLFAEPVGEELTAEEVKALIEKSPSVHTAWVEKSSGGILIETQLFPTQLHSGQRVMLLRTESFAKMLRSVRERFGTGGEAVVYQQGYEAGFNEAAGLVKMIGKQELVQRAEQIAQLRTALGWGEATLTKVQANPWKRS